MMQFSVIGTVSNDILNYTFSFLRPRQGQFVFAFIADQDAKDVAIPPKVNTGMKYINASKLILAESKTKFALKKVSQRLLQL